MIDALNVMEMLAQTQIEALKDTTTSPNVQSHDVTSSPIPYKQNVTQTYLKAHFTFQEGDPHIL